MYESLDVLGYRRQKELLPNKLQPPQAQATQSDLILQFGKEGFHFLTLPLGPGKLGRLHQVPRALPRRFVLVNDQAAEGSTDALWSK